MWVRFPLRTPTKGKVALDRNPSCHQIVPPVAARQEEVARDYLKRAARIGELNGHPPGSDGPMATALMGYSGGRVL